MRGCPHQANHRRRRSHGGAVDRGREVMAVEGTRWQPIPISQRRIDLLFVAFFLLNFGFITYVVDLEQLVIADPARFSYPLWPPAPLVDLVHWYGDRFDPLLMARPPFWRMTIWIDVLYFGPFYLAATYAFVRGRDWIRVPALVWSGLMTANVLIILMEERYGAWATPTSRSCSRSICPGSCYRPR
jgi:hypothetical protein